MFNMIHPSNGEIRAALAQSRVYFSVAADDTAVPPTTLREQIEVIRPPSGVVLNLETGGHGAIFTEQGVERLVEEILR